MCWYFSIRIISFHQAETSTSSEPTATKKRTAERNDARQKEDIVDSSNKRSNRAAPTTQPDDEDSEVADAIANKRKKVAPDAKSAPKVAPSSVAGKSLKQTKLTDAVASSSSRRILR
jgi:hypothetical protein